LSLKFNARGGAAPLDVSAYNCTSVGLRQHPPIWACDDCGMLFQWPHRSEAELIRAYREVEDPLYVVEKENRYLTFRRVLKRVGPAGGRTLLDAGAYCGYFLDVAREAGFAVEGLELSRWAAAQARALGVPVHEQTLADRRGHARYDVVTLWDIIEHFADPRAELEHVFELLRPGGQVFISTIDCRSLIARALGAHWPWLLEMHLFYFDRRTLPMLLESVGFRVLDRRNYTHIVSSGYLLRKTALSFPALSAAVGLAEKVLPHRVPIPVNLGDNMMVVAERP
jgi:SAM-dependent methyltransferase